MTQNLDNTFRQWLENLSLTWGISVDQVANNIANEEILNRHDAYPNLARVFSQPTLNQKEIIEATNECWALGHRFNAIRLSQFINTGDQAFSPINDLLSDFPEKDQDAAKRIDDFIERAVDIAFNSKNGKDRSGAALFCSVILTSLYPDRFVDFRSSRWQNLARTFEYRTLPSKDSGYGDWILWAGHFAADLSETKTYKIFWPDENALWTVAGIAWTGPSPEKPDIESFSIEEIESFPEGAEKRRLHTSRERNALLIRKAKDRRYQIDPLLRCDVCGFSFIEQYGERGEKFIEAHHKIPVASLKPDDQTRVEDIALICSNCHRMIHRGDKTLSVEELRELI